MRMKLLYFAALAIIGFDSAFAGARVLPLASNDANEVHSILFQAGLVTEYPGAEYARVDKLNCNLDLVQIRQGISEEDATTCSGTINSTPMTLKGRDAMGIFRILQSYAQLEEYPGASYIEVDFIEVNYDRAAGTLTGTVGVSANGLNATAK